MAVPLMRAYNFVAPAALNTFGLAVDNITGLTVQQLNRDNVLLDFVDNPANAALSAFPFIVKYANLF